MAIFSNMKDLVCVCSSLCPSFMRLFGNYIRIETEEGITYMDLHFG